MPVAQLLECTFSLSMRLSIFHEYMSKHLNAPLTGV